MPKFYAKKPVPVQAICVSPTNWREILDFVPSEYFGGGVWLDKGGDEVEGSNAKYIGLSVRTADVLGGVKGDYHTAKEGDFILKISTNQGFAFEILSGDHFRSSYFELPAGNIDKDVFKNGKPIRG